VFLEVRFIILYQSLSFTHYLLVNAGEIILLHFKVNYLSSRTCCLTSLRESEDGCVRTTTPLLFWVVMHHFIMFASFPILARSSLLINFHFTGTVRCYPLIVLKRILIVRCPLGYLPAWYEIVNLDDLCWWTARRLMNNLIVGRDWTEAWFLLVERNALASAWTRSNLHTHSRSECLISGRWCGWDIDRGTLSSPRLTWAPTAGITILTMCGDITGNRASSQFRNHLFGVHLCYFLDKLIHHSFILHDFSYVYDFVLFEVVED
jgi:hypothetical protein